MKKEALILITENYADWEIGFLAPLLNNPSRSHQVKMVSLEDKIIKSQGGLQVVANYTIQNMPDDYVILILVGGTYWSEKKFQLPQVKNLIDDCVKKGILVAGICDGATFLAENGYLDQIPHTGNSLEHIKTYAPNYKGECYFEEKQCVVSNHIVTANGTANLEFSREILKQLDVKLPIGFDEWYSYYKKGVYK